jgi:hypothetical protein
MTQSAVLKVSYEAVFSQLADLGKSSKLFTASEDNAQESSKDETLVYLSVSDISQIAIDKNGQTIEVDEVMFSVPSQIGCVLSITISAQTYPPLLETAGLLIQHFKDNNVIELPEYTWHGETDGRIFLEPVVRDVKTGEERQRGETPSRFLEYRVEAGINSLKGTSFKRVEKKAVKGEIIGE